MGPAVTGCFWYLLAIAGTRGGHEREVVVCEREGAPRRGATGASGGVVER